MGSGGESRQRALSTRVMAADRDEMRRWTSYVSKVPVVTCRDDEAGQVKGL